MSNLRHVPITPPRVNFIDPRTGNVSREWYMFFLSMFQSQGGSTISLDDVQKGAPAVSVDELNVAISNLSQNLTSPNEGWIEQIAELQKQMESLSIQSNGILDQITELQKQVQDLSIQPNHI